MDVLPLYGLCALPATWTLLIHLPCIAASQDVAAIKRKA
jgi:hypothetical protein